MRRYRYLYVSQGVLALFLGIMAYVIVIAYSRRSGSTGLDMAAIQKLRYETVLQESASPSPVSPP
jgi:hypothetical protein